MERRKFLGGGLLAAIGLGGCFPNRSAARAYDPNAPKILFKNDPTSPQSITSTTANSIYNALPTGGTGYLGFRANSLQVGSIVRLECSGSYITPAVPGAARVRVSVGGTNGLDVTVNASVLATSAASLSLIGIIYFQVISISGTSGTMKVSGQMNFMTAATGAWISGSTAQAAANLSATISFNPTIDNAVNVPASFNTTSTNQGTTIDTVLMIQY